MYIFIYVCLYIGKVPRKSTAAVWLLSSIDYGQDSVKVARELTDWSHLKLALEKPAWWLTLLAISVDAIAGFISR